MEGPLLKSRGLFRFVEYENPWYLGDLNSYAHKFRTFAL
jgi:hypothetical protein